MKNNNFLINLVNKTIKHKKQYLILFMLIIIETIVLAGCGGRNKVLTEKELSKILPENITSYIFDGEQHEQEVKELKIIKRKTEKSDDFVECSILLQDIFLTRTVFADLFLTYYDTGGWLVDNWKPYDEEIVQPVLPPDPVTIQHQIENEFHDFTQTGSDGSHLSEGIYTSSFDIFEKHAFVTFTGKIICNSTLSGYMASKSEMAGYYWVNDLQQDIKTDWNIEGEWLMTEEGDNQPEKVYVSIDLYEPDQERVYITAYRAWPAVGTLGTGYLGYYGSYTAQGYTKIYEEGTNADNIVLNIPTGLNQVRLICKADSIIPSISNLEDHDFTITRAETQKIYDDWNSFPKGVEFEFPTSRK